MFNELSWYFVMLLDWFISDAVFIPEYYLWNFGPAPHNNWHSHRNISTTYYDYWRNIFLFYLQICYKELSSTLPVLALLCARRFYPGLNRRLYVTPRNFYLLYILFNSFLDGLLRAWTWTKYNSCARRRTISIINFITSDIHISEELCFMNLWNLSLIWHF